MRWWLENHIGGSFACGLPGKHCLETYLCPGIHNGLGICRILANGQYEILLHNQAECGFGITAKTAVALDQERHELGPAPLRTARGLTYVLPVNGAFSYLLKP